MPALGETRALAQLLCGVYCRLLLFLAFTRAPPPLITNTVDASSDRHGAGGKWEKIDGKLKHVAVSANGEHIWGTNASHQVFHRQGKGGTWNLIPGALIQVSVSRDGSHVWGVNAAHDIFRASCRYRVRLAGGLHGHRPDAGAI